VGVVSAAVDILRTHVPTLSLGVLYVLAVLPVAVFLGRLYAIGVSFASVLVFNFLFLPPTYELTLSGEENWLIVGVFLTTGLLVSELAARARQRARDAEQREREAALLAEFSTALLSGAEVPPELPRIAEATAHVLRLPQARIELGEASLPREGEVPIELSAGDRRVGTLYVGAGGAPNQSARRRFLPALASLLAVAVDRERLAREALEAEALRRSDSLKTALLRSVSHDLRSPLTAIQASLEALGTPDLALDPLDRESLRRTALAESKRLDRVVGNLLDLSRLQAGAPRLDLTLRTVEGLLDQACVEIGDDRRVEISLAPDLPLVLVDSVQLEHALVNLLENAIKFSPRDSAVDVGVSYVAGEVLVRIADRGPGLDAGELELVFEPFRHGSSAGERKGAGLGLAIAKGFIEANGGRVWAESRPGEGASFVVALPAALDGARAGVGSEL
jgi:two-component system sensor histidine kinase KdpD